MAFDCYLRQLFFDSCMAATSCPHLILHWFHDLLYGFEAYASNVDWFLEIQSMVMWVFKKTPHDVLRISLKPIYKIIVHAWIMDGQLVAAMRRAFASCMAFDCYLRQLFF